MEWLTEILDNPGITGAGGGVVVFLLFQLGMALFKWQTTSAESEGKEADAQARTSDALTSLAAAIGTLATTAQSSAEANMMSAKANQATTETIRSIRDTITVMMSETNKFQTEVAQSHKAHADDFGLLKQTLEVVKTMTETETNGKLDIMLAQLTRIESIITDAKVEAATLNQAIQAISARLERAEHDVIVVKEEVSNIKKRETSEHIAATEEQEVAAIPPQETTDKPLTDAPASEG